MTSEHVSSETNTGLDITSFPRLKEQAKRLKAAGLDPENPEYRHANALLVAADFMELNNASLVNKNAAMVLLSLISSRSHPEGFDTTVEHEDGSRARLSVRFGANASFERPDPNELVSLPDPREAGRWLTRTAVSAETIESLVQTFAQASNSSPGGYPSEVGTGAVLALIQAVEATRGSILEVNLSGWGPPDPALREDVALMVVLEGPKPSQKARPAR